MTSFFLKFYIAPPTYEEAMFMTTNIADDDANTVSEQAQFTPRYPVFDVDDVVVTSMGQTPPPNPPIKKKKKKKRNDQQQRVQDIEKEKLPRESPIEI